MDSADPQRIIIEGNFLNFTLSDACSAARDRAAELEVTPAAGLTYPDGKDVLAVKLYFQKARIAEITYLRGRATASVQTRIQALDLCYPYESSTATRFSLRLVKPEEVVLDWNVQHFIMSLAQFADEMRNVQMSGEMQIYQRAPVLEEAALTGGSLLGGLPKMATDEESVFLNVVMPFLEGGVKFTTAQLAERSGLSLTCCALYVSKLIEQNIITEEGKNAPAYGGTVTKGKRFIPPPFARR